MPKQCLFIYGGFEADGGGSFTIQGSTQPSRGQLSFRLGYNLPAFGRLVITDGSNSINLEGCRLVSAAVGGGTSGRYREVVIEDRRWRWRYAYLWGEYNVPSDRIATSKGARELAVLCFQALGEQQYNVSALPNDSYPEISWSGESAAAALESLCMQYGCIVAPTASGAWIIHKLGVGNRPPQDSRMTDYQAARQPVVIPNQVVFEGGHTLWQHDLPLEAIGAEDFTNKHLVKPIDELSYKPANGWAGEHPDTFRGVTAKKRELAKRCIWRMYRVVGGFQLTIPPAQLPNGTGGGRLTPSQTQQQQAYYKVDAGKEWRILPLEQTQLSLFASSLLGSDAADAQIVGYFREDKHRIKNNAATIPASIDDKDQVVDTSLDESLIYQGNFSLDATRGIVSFSEPVFLFDRTGGKNTQRLPAKIRLRTSFGLRDPDTNTHLCQQYWYAPAGSSNQNVAELVKREEAIYEIGKYPGQPDTVTNQSEYIANALLYMQEVLNGYTPDDSITIPYKGFVFDVGLSGSIKAITWRSGPQGGTTSIDYGNDRSDVRLSTKDLQAKAMELQYRIDAAAAKKQNAAAKRKRNKRPI